MSHIFGFGEACLGNTLGFTTYLSDPVERARPACRGAPDVFMSVPAYWEKLGVMAAAEAPDNDARRARSPRSPAGDCASACPAARD